MGKGASRIIPKGSAGDTKEQKKSQLGSDRESREGKPGFYRNNESNRLWNRGRGGNEITLLGKENSTRMSVLPQ